MSASKSSGVERTHPTTLLALMMEMSSADNKSGLAKGAATTADCSCADAPLTTLAQRLERKLPPAKDAFQRAFYVKLNDMKVYLQTMMDTLIAAIKTVSSLGGMSLSIRVTAAPIDKSTDNIGALEQTRQDPDQFVMRVPKGHTTEEIFAILSEVFTESNAKNKAGEAKYSFALARLPYPFIAISWDHLEDADAASH
jgi:hypothetical protein